MSKILEMSHVFLGDGELARVDVDSNRCYALKEWDVDWAFSTLACLGVAFVSAPSCLLDQCLGRILPLVIAFPLLVSRCKRNAHDIRPTWT